MTAENLEMVHTSVLTKEEREEVRTYTVREMIAALANAENMDATVCIALRSIKHEPVEVSDLEYDPENDLFTLTA